MKDVTLTIEVQDHTADLIQELAKEDETLFLLRDGVSHSIGSIRVVDIYTVDEEIENPMIGALIT